MAKAPTKRKAAGPKKNPLAAAKARVAKLEGAAKKQTAIAAAKKQIDAGKAALKRARGSK